MTPVPPPSTDETVARPRIEGDRELEILNATLEVLDDVGYDRLTMDAVASRSKSSKATLYRRWTSKASLVIDALLVMKTAEVAPDTGSLRGDLIEAACGFGGLSSQKPVGVLASIITAINRDADFASAFREKFLGPKMEISNRIFERARERGEIRDDLDIELLSPALAGIVLHRVFVMGELADDELITRVIDQIIVPCARK